MNDLEARESIKKLIAWIESFGIEIIDMSEDGIVTEHPGGRQQEICMVELNFMNGYLFGTLSKALCGKY